ncbi:fimbrial biogenesis outer membrane usher protein [Citrobacter amalonaticus]|uniref:Fimbrial biogenesis outer membrane usher protein n=1 Tax=Citrobacter amalonaticus TaxID=35703 RepID=A0A2S4RS11_CITAM|nr:fimbria/pilus outer membrane usher protein [Citrobacter amalonaticus]POT55710.1 fimbrial biogenesis outer membrane usher protein [Citrobacter amalonaticus]POT73923.1 fimbrial biogenesis outer membrane usher protein [Citrobacter amalonaticus]POU62304.1 fimbrial biogenesis outer membrane usher protein [Citrobacter amalonaticus]POV02806.1 fimbrial biogenesis outer membrane usher protein [Citrobacter amalonaticus]
MLYIPDAKTLHNNIAGIPVYFSLISGRLVPIKKLLIALILCPPFAYSETQPVEEIQYQFDDAMLVGRGKDQQIVARFNQANSIAAGTYQVDIFINGNFYSRQSLSFAPNAQGIVSPCLPPELLVKGGVAPESITATENTTQCATLESQIEGASNRFDFARLRLDLFIPQALMIRTPRGSVSAGDLSAGETVAFANYDTNYYRTDASGQTSESTYLGLNAGLNLGLWQLRHQANYNRYASDSAPGSSHWTPLRTYVQRPVMALRSELTLGDSYTSGTLFSSIGFRGIQLETDDRMLPESQRGYAPTIRGIASTTAKVTVSQSGSKIYQTTVAPGAFIIDDLYPTSYQGDLVVEIQEADGRVSSFTVPFSAVPNSMRPGRSHVNFSAGQVRDIGDSDANFADLTWQTGLTNAITANSGVRISQGYQSLLGGFVLTNQLGALGLDAVYSRADVLGENLNGWRLGATYSRTFAPTATTLALAGYRYSTDGYRDLSDVLGLRDAHDRSGTWNSSTYQQKNQFVLTVSQGLSSYGQLYVSGSTSDYRDGRGRDTQYQMGYSNSWRSVSYNLSLSRQRTGSTRYGVQTSQDNSNNAAGNSGSTQNILMFSISVPLGEGSRSPILTSGMSHQSGDSRSTYYQSSLAGTLGENQTLSYTLNGAYDNAGTGTTVGTNVTKQLPWATIGGSASHNRDYTQGGASLRGALVAHSGGITLGPYLGDTFGLVEADGVHGAEVQNGMGAKINSFGYAIVPSLVPYRYNDISLDSKGIKNQSAELAENQQRVAPYAGAAVKVRFRTLEGYPLLIKILRKPEENIPLGSDVYDSKNAVVGLVGQGNQVYARASAKKGTLRVKWGESPSGQCLLKYDLRNTDLSQTLHRLDLPCNGI